VDSTGLGSSVGEQAARRWVEAGVAAGVHRVRQRLGFSLQLRRKEHSRSRLVPEPGWCQEWSGISRSVLSVHMTPEDEDDLVQAVLASSLRPVEPSREIIVEMVNVLLNGLSDTLRRALDVEVRSSLPRPSTPAGIRLCRASWSLALPVHGFRFDVSWTIPEDEQLSMNRRLARSMAALVDAVTT
jgi:hypothetical protein